MGRAGRGARRSVLDLLGALVAALLAFTAVPAVLALVVGNPLGGGLGHAWQPASRDALCVVVLAAWVAWTACSAQLVRGIVGHVRRGAPDAAAGASVLDRLAARIAVGVIALGSLGAPLAAATVASAAAPPASRVEAQAPPAATHEPTGPLQRRDDVAPGRVVVHEGDSLWSIAQAYLDDGGAWTTLASLNLGQTMRDGTRFVDPGQVRAGWQLRLPEAERPATNPPVTRGASRGHLDARLPELAVLGIGSLTCAALARRARRRRDRSRLFAEMAHPLSMDEHGRLGDPRADALSPDAVDAATLLARFENVPALPAFEAANVLLGATCGRAGGSGPLVRTVCVGPEGVTFWLRVASPDAPAGFVALDGGAAWRVGHDRLSSVRPADPYLPIAFPVGEDDDGTWLVALNAGDVLPLLGPSAGALWRAARTMQESWTWADRVVVVEHAGDPLLDPRPADGSGERHILFFGDPASLAPAVARHASIVTTNPVSGSDLSILVDARAATIHPVGRVVRPHLLAEHTARAVDEFVAGSAAALERPVPATDARAHDVTEREQVAMPVPATARPERPSLMEPGTVEVRLLTVTPRLDGLVEELPPNRARRAVELVAYLALHHPDVVTSDRLRTRVLGSADADAAAKTLFNTAYAARRAMGLDAQGDPLFPGASRNGLYGVSTDVTVDVQRAIGLVETAKASEYEDVALASYCGALNLVEGEPLANALAGYTWWETEGHAGRIAAVLVDAACALAALAPDRGLFDLAQWGLEQARLVAPYSEALSRSAMELAAAEGDADRLRLEWRTCQRMVDALDPGASPSPRTESLYGELSRRVLVPSGRREWPARYAPATSDCTSAADP